MNATATSKSRRLFRPARQPRTRLGVEALENRIVPAVNFVESEPNNTPATADVIARLPATQVVLSGAVDAAGDRDWFRLDLRAGDVVGAVVKGQTGLNPAVRLINAAGDLMMSNDDLARNGTFLPQESPLPHSTRSATDAGVYYVIATAGTYFLEVSASADASTGKYDLDTMVARPGTEALPAGSRQILFLDFDGSTVNFSHFIGRKGFGINRLSPLAPRLPEWGLTAADVDAVIDAVIARVSDGLSTYVGANGLNSNFGIQILNSRDHTDRFGNDPLVSRVVVGGTQAEAEFPGNLIGEAEDVDVGNYKTDDEAVATLDFVKGGIDFYHPAADRLVDFVATGIAALVLHEAGHIFGCFHTDQPEADHGSGVPSLMDGDVLANLVRAFGPDAVFGTSDDFTLRYAVDGYGEAFQGRDDALNTVAFGLSVGTATASARSYAILGQLDALTIHNAAARRDEVAWPRVSGSKLDLASTLFVDAASLNLVTHKSFPGDPNMTGPSVVIS
jgi:hypothetical protein